MCILYTKQKISKYSQQVFAVSIITKIVLYQRFYSSVGKTHYMLIKQNTTQIMY